MDFSFTTHLPITPSTQKRIPTPPPQPFEMPENPETGLLGRSDLASEVSEELKEAMRQNSSSLRRNHQ